MKYDRYLEDAIYDPMEEYQVDAGLSVSFDFTTFEKYGDQCESRIEEILDDLEECVKGCLDDYRGDIETAGYTLDDIVIIRD